MGKMRIFQRKYMDFPVGAIGSELGFVTGFLSQNGGYPKCLSQNGALMIKHDKTCGFGVIVVSYKPSNPYLGKL
jgi:hypothetical protein